MTLLAIPGHLVGSGAVLVDREDTESGTQLGGSEIVRESVEMHLLPTTKDQRDTRKLA